MADRAPLDYPVFQAFDANGDPLVNGKVEFFDAGTTNQRDTYSDPGLTTANPNPVTLNSRGEPESGGGTPINIYLDASPYKIVLKDSDDVTIRTIDDYLRPDVGESISAPKDPINATDVGTDIFEAVFTDPKSGEVFTIDFQSSNTTTTPTLENTGGSLGALTIKTRDGSPVWSGAVNGTHTLYYDGTDLLLLDPRFGQNLSTSGKPSFSELTVNGQLEEDPEHATDSGTDAYVSATNTTAPAGGVTITRDFQSANTTTTPTLDTLTITTRDGSALWANALSGVHELQLNAGGTAWLVLDPNPLIPAGTQATSSNTANAIVQRDANGRAKFADPSAAQDAATKAYTDAATLKVFHYRTGNSSEQTTSLDVSAGTFEVIYTLEITIEVGDIIQVMGEAEFTSDDTTYNYLITSQLYLATSSTATTGDEISEANGRNITPDTHHETQPKVGTIVSPYTGTYYVNYVARANSTSGVQDPLVEIDYGRLSVIVLRP